VRTGGLFLTRASQPAQTLVPWSAGQEATSRATTSAPPWEALAGTPGSRAETPGLGVFSYIPTALKPHATSPGPSHQCPSTGGQAWALQTGELQEALAHPHSSLGWPWGSPAASPWPKLCPWLETAQGQGRAGTSVAPGKQLQVGSRDSWSHQRSLRPATQPTSKGALLSLHLFAKNARLPGWTPMSVLPVPLSPGGLW